MHHLKNFLLAATILFSANLATAQELVFTIDATQAAQTVDNIGASGCWFSEGIGKYWPLSKKQQIAELLFSKDRDAAGNPRGIGLSAWRFNIGGGTAEQGAESGIKDPRRRVECFLEPNGTYNWNKQQGYQWFLQQAKNYGVERLIAFSNSPPVQFNQNGLGFKTTRDYRSNLKADSYGKYANFLATVIAHFDSVGLHFNYISPINEPQWDWSNTKGPATQEGTPWTNAEIFKTVSALNGALQQKKLSTQILTPEAAQLDFLYSKNTAASRQIQNFFSDTGKYSFKNLNHVPRIAAGHSYFTDAGDSTIISSRKTLADTAAKYNTTYWETEYSMLEDGYKEGFKASRTAIDCALFLAKIINRDFTIAGARAWQFWNAYEPGRADKDTRYYLIALHPNADHTDGDFTAVKNLWALGNYSLFIRPGMQRLNTQRSDGLSAIAESQDVMVAAFKQGKKGVIAVLINYTSNVRSVRLDLKHFRKFTSANSYVTSQTDDLKLYALKNAKGTISLKPRSITTVVLN